ncbi:MAG: hypothetical protein LBH16_01345 [Treponema sp.]|jgi:hypothetical protein|nr:hypothetical protein [Treponema sp.]
MIDEALSLLTDLGEFALDSFIGNGIIKDVPIIGPTFDIIKISKNINDMVFIGKLKVFMENVDKNEKWKDKFSDESECEKISKKILYIINSSDDEDKLKLIGFSFNLFVNGEINKDDYFFIVNIFNQSFFPYLKLLMEIDFEQFTNNGEIFNMYAIAHLLTIGALDQYSQTLGGYDESKTYIPSHKIVCINYFGKYIKNILMQMNNKKQK